VKEEVGDTDRNCDTEPVGYRVQFIQLEEHCPKLLLLRHELQLPRAGTEDGSAA
jgi:hypothetical protein